MVWDHVRVLVGGEVGLAIPLALSIARAQARFAFGSSAIARTTRVIVRASTNTEVENVLVQERTSAVNSFITGQGGEHCGDPPRAQLARSARESVLH